MKPSKITMGIWSEYVHTYTPSVKVDFSKLQKSTLEFLNGISASKGTKYNSSTTAMTVDELGRGSSDCARIWGYVDNVMKSELHGLIAGLSSTAEMIFSCDTDDIRYFLIRFDKLMNIVQFFVINEEELNCLTSQEFLKRVSSIPWVLYEDSVHAKRDFDNLQYILEKHPSLTKGEVALIMTMKNT